MLKIIIESETFNDETQEFSPLVEAVIDLEHSLLSMSKWESKHQKPFLGPNEKTKEEMFDYLKCMVTSINVDPDVLYSCSQSHIDKIQEYIDSTQSATTFGMMPERGGQGEKITSELIYYWMVAFNIPFECEKWHLNRLFALIRICNIKNSSPKKMSRNEIAQRNAELNAKRRAELGTSG